MLFRSFTFAKDFKKQAEDLKFLGGLVLFLRKCKFVKDYSALLAFEELFKRLSKTFETDLTYKIRDWIKSFKGDLRQLQLELLMLSDDIQEAGYKANRIYYLSESFIDELMTLPFDPDKTKPDKEAAAIYFEKIKGILGDDF